MANQMSRSGEPRGPKAWRVSSSKALKLLRRVEIQVSFMKFWKLDIYSLTQVEKALRPEYMQKVSMSSYMLFTNKVP